ncbi:MAG: hypothetical protein ACXVRS_00180 [Gaiellaceae bacterium]
MARWINEHGQVVVAAGCLAGRGPCRADAAYREFLWQNGRFEQIGDHVYSTALSGRGEVVGSTGPAGGNQRAFYWKNGRKRDLPGRGASGINARGEVVGAARNAAGQTRAFIWHRSGAITEIGPLPGRSFSAAMQIDDTGTVLGHSWSNDDSRPDMIKDDAYFLWRNGHRIELGPLGGPLVLRSRRLISHSHVGYCSEPSIWVNGRATRINARPWDDSCALAMNDKGEIAGYEGLSCKRGFVWRKGRITRFWMPAGSDCGIAINNHGQLAITISFPQSVGATEPRAYVRNSRSLTALPTLGGRWSLATAINDAGAIVGWSTDKSGQQHAVLWTLRQTKG